jgi:hypothetical protein
MLHPILFQVANQTQGRVGAHLVLLILACIFFAFSAFAPFWGQVNASPYYSRLNSIGLGLFCWSLSWFF